MKLTRRTFLQNTAALAGGAAAGLLASNGIRKYGPVEIRTYFLSNDPLVIKGALFADDRKDVFGIRAFDEHGGQMCLIEMPLHDMKKIIDRRSSNSKVIVLIVDEHGKKDLAPLAVTVEHGNLTFFVNEEGEKPSPVWLRLSDVQRVL